jgi:hypothetical protein
VRLSLDYHGKLAGVAAEVRERRRGGVMNDNAFTPDEIGALTQLNELCRRWLERLPDYEGSLLQDFFEIYAETGSLLQEHRERLAEDPLEQIPVASRQKIAALRRKMMLKRDEREA